MSPEVRPEAPSPITGFGPAEAGRHVRAHPPALAHHFDNLAQQREASTLGMWVFLATEILFFGGVMAVYAVYRNWYAEGFAAASHELDILLGSINTAVLITSSLTMALGVYAAETGRRRQLLVFLMLTMVLGALLPDDRPARASHDHRPRHPGVDAVVGLERNDHQRVLEPNRDQRTLLALRRHRVDLSVPTALSVRAPRMRQQSSINLQSAICNLQFQQS
jgi:hypothetical protein